MLSCLTLNPSLPSLTIESELRLPFGCRTDSFRPLACLTPHQVTAAAQVQALEQQKLSPIADPQGAHRKLLLSVMFAFRVRKPPSTKVDQRSFADPQPPATAGWLTSQGEGASLRKFFHAAAFVSPSAGHEQPTPETDEQLTIKTSNKHQLRRKESSDVKKNRLQGMSLDADSDESVQEQLRHMLSAKGMRVIDIFRDWDEDGDGLIDKTEFRSALTALGIQADKDKMNALFDTFDANSDGRIDCVELNKKLRLKAPGKGIDIIKGSRLRSINAFTVRRPLTSVSTPAATDSKVDHDAVHETSDRHASPEQSSQHQSDAPMDGPMEARPGDEGDNSSPPPSPPLFEDEGDQPTWLVVHRNIDMRAPKTLADLKQLLAEGRILPDTPLISLQNAPPSKVNDHLPPEERVVRSAREHWHRALRKIRFMKAFPRERVGKRGVRKLKPLIEAAIVKQGIADGTSLLGLTMCTTTVCFAAGISSPVQAICQFSLLQTMILLAYCALSACTAARRDSEIGMLTIHLLRSDLCLSPFVLSQ